MIYQADCEAQLYQAGPKRFRGVSTVGNNQPLFVVDGVPIGDGTSNQINPADVESISVLKDASRRFTDYVRPMGWC